jgi:hypothetical protein
VEKKNPFFWIRGEVTVDKGTFTKARAGLTSGKEVEWDERGENGWKGREISDKSSYGANTNIPLALMTFEASSVCRAKNFKREDDRGRLADRMVQATTPVPASHRSVNPRASQTSAGQWRHVQSDDR